MAALKRFALAYLRNPAAGIGLLLLIAIAKKSKGLIEKKSNSLNIRLLLYGYFTQGRPERGR